MRLNAAVPVKVHGLLYQWGTEPAPPRLLRFVRRWLFLRLLLLLRGPPGHPRVAFARLAEIDSVARFGTERMHLSGECGRTCATLAGNNFQHKRDALSGCNVPSHIAFL
jgi:hypothetical protein